MNRVEILRAHLDTAADSLAPTKRGEGWSEGIWSETFRLLPMNLTPAERPLTLPSPPVGERVAEGRVRGFRGSRREMFLENLAPERPLILTFSPEGEKEQPLDVSLNFDSRRAEAVRGLAKPLETIPPLPGGEGRGEGKARALAIRTCIVIKSIPRRIISPLHCCSPHLEFQIPPPNWWCAWGWTPHRARFR